MAKSKERSHTFTAGPTLALNTTKPVQKIIAVGVVTENLPALDATANDIVPGTRCIDAGSA